MSGIKVDVAWSPVQDDLFLTCKSEINLYKTEELLQGEPLKPQAMKISDDSQAVLQSTNAEHQYIKCIAWYPKPEPANLVAVGLANGRVILTSFGKGNTSDPHRLCQKEFVPKHQRQCSYLAWNPVESNLLAEGVERTRADFSVLIWDVYHLQRAAFFDYMHSDRKNTSNYSAEPSIVIQKPSVELGSGETTLSLAWFPHEPQSLVTGMNNKFLRIFDLRDTSRPQNAAYTKAVYGVRVDPMSQYRLASFHETHLSIWDTRNFEKPVCTIVENKNILKLAWSPTRCGLLGCLSKESSVVKLYDIQHAMLADEIEPTSSAERRLTYPDQQTVSSFDWHPTQKNRMLMVTPTGAVSDIGIFERIAVSWSPNVNLSWACGQQLWQANAMSVCEDTHQDISTLMYSRALAGYGIQQDIQNNAKIIGMDQSLKNLWLWIKHMKDLLAAPAAVGTELVPANSPPIPMTKSPSHLHRGIKGLVCDGPVQAIASDNTSRSAIASDNTNRSVIVSDNTSRIATATDNASRSWVELWSWQTMDGYKSLGRRKVYHSHERMKALELCGWCYCKDKPSSPIIDKLEADGQFERAASIAVFNMKIGRAIEVLHKGSKYYQGGNVNLSVVAMALAGFSDEKNTMWQDISSRLSTELQHPYLRIMFSLLTMENDNWDGIVNDPQLEVCDRVAIACFYLSDSKLAEFIEQLQSDLSSNGDLSGILLTGFSRDCLELFQNYVDTTGDVQTAAVALIQALPNNDLSQDPRLGQWINTYRDLLDTWTLWHQRAEFDVYRQKCDRMSRGPPWVKPQVFVSCNFCGKSVSFSSLATRSRTFMFGGPSAHKPRVTSCPSCRKPLPRCALCLINMGTSAGGGTRPPGSKELESEGQRLAKFSDWFTWCQSCRHGGHAEHMTEWYKEHVECPVTGCGCKCASVDVIGSSTGDMSVSAS